jgi:glycosyltransferase involved in cell wall biosynthesis
MIERNMSGLPRTATVVISCFNYARFVGSAIESALRQNRPPLEIIVVDDGSTDGSREVIRGFADRVRPIFKEHAGMASALNAGCRAAGGDVVFLLDADDLLFPDALETVLEQWRSDTVMTQSRLAMGDAQGRRVRGTAPAPEVRLDEGDVRAVLLANGAYSVTLTSGIALRRAELLAVLPIPEDRFVGAADGYLVRAIAFLGQIQAVDRPLALYRRHGTNDTEFGASQSQRGTYLRKRIGWMRTEFDLVKALASRHGLAAVPDVGERNADYLFLRLCSLVMDPENHPLSGDTRLGLWPPIMRSVLAARSPLGFRNVVYIGLVSGIVALPRWAAWRLVAWWLSPETRPTWLGRLASWVRGPKAGN